MKRILVADDDPLILDVLGHMLPSPDYVLAKARDGLEALELIRGQDFDLVLTDIWMPGMDGLELLERARELKPGLRFIVMTADNTPDNVVRSIRSQAYDYLVKPFPLQVLRDVVRHALEAPSGEIEVVVARPDWIELRLPCELGAAHRVYRFLNEVKADLPAEVREAVGVAFRELLTNAIEHGGHFDPTERVTICYIRMKRMILYRISDPGHGFHLDEIGHAAVANPPEDPLRHMEVRQEQGLRSGGFGILLARRVVDELIYNDKQNEVLFVKYLD